MLHLTEMSYLYVVGSRKLYMLLLNCLYLTGQTLAMSIILGIYLSRFKKNEYNPILMKVTLRYGKLHFVGHCLQLQNIENKTVQFCQVLYPISHCIVVKISC